MGRHSIDLRFRSLQPDTSLYCKTTDTGLVHDVVCMFPSQPKLVVIADLGGMDSKAGLIDVVSWFHAEMVYGHPSTC